MNNILAKNMKVVLGSAKPETAMSGVAYYPANGSFIDVSGYEYVHILAHLGTLHTSDTPVLTPKCCDAATLGTADTIDSTLAHTCDVTNDDGQCVVWTIQVDTLPVDHHFLTLATSGTLTNGSYIDVLFLLDKARELPVTQDTTNVLPAAHQYSWAG
jgi:hypothetical protein